MVELDDMNKGETGKEGSMSVETEDNARYYRATVAFEIKQTLL
jgi:hypothetical protein